MKKLTIMVLAFLISGCAANVQTSSTQQGPKESVGALSGMVIGGALANDMAGDSRNKSIATVLGAFVGGVIGQNIGAQLDERDRLLVRLTIRLLNITRPIRLLNGETRTPETMVASYQ